MSTGRNCERGYTPTDGVIEAWSHVPPATPEPTTTPSKIDLVALLDWLAKRNSNASRETGKPSIEEILAQYARRQPVKYSQLGLCVHGDGRFEDDEVLYGQTWQLTCENVPVRLFVQDGLDDETALKLAKELVSAFEMMAKKKDNAACVSGDGADIEF